MCSCIATCRWTLDEPLDKFLPEMTDIKILNEKNILIEPKVKITYLLTTAGFGLVHKKFII